MTRPDGVVPGATVVTVPLQYTNRSLAMLSLVRQARVRVDDEGVRPLWWVNRVGGAIDEWGALVAWNAKVLSRLRAVGAVRVRVSDRLLMVSDFGEALGPVWTDYARATGQEASVLALVNEALEAPPVPPSTSPLRS